MTETEAEQILRVALRNCTADWGEDFSFDIELEDVYQSFTYFSVIAAHAFLEPEFQFSARVHEGGSCYFDASGNGAWWPIDKGNLFAAMWLDVATPGEADK